MNDGIVTGDRPVPCCAALRQKQVVNECIVVKFELYELYFWLELYEL